MNNKIRAALAVLFFFLFCVLHSLFSSAANAAIPHLINYQGRLTDTNGAPLNGSYNIVFRIFDAENAGNLLWQGTYNNTAITKGIFNILLGDINDTGYNFQNLTFDKSYWLEIKVGEDEPMKPRQRITSTGYAIRAEKADSLYIPAQQGDILYHNGSAWTKLEAGTPGQFLKSQGAGANPVWETIGWRHSGAQVYNGTVSTSWSDLDLSNIVGTNKALVMIKGENPGTGLEVTLLLRTKGDSEEIKYTGGISAIRLPSDYIGYGFVETNSSGVIQIKDDWGNIRLRLTVVGYIK